MLWWSPAGYPAEVDLRDIGFGPCAVREVLYPYFMRRLAERPANIWFVLKNLFK
jgi:hypothetical protein